jgi:tetratricopeptide (TPR) repeat protein
MTVLPDGSAHTEISAGPLSEERDFLLRSLADLDAEYDAGDLDDRDYRTLRDGYVTRAAAILRICEGREYSLEDQSVLAGGAHDWTAGRERHTWIGERTNKRLARQISVGALVLALAVASGVLVAREAGQRLPGDTISGSLPTSDAARLLGQASAETRAGDVLGALRLYQRVIAVDPQNVEALANSGWLIALAGRSSHDLQLKHQLIGRGLASIRQAEQNDPTYAIAHFYAGSVLLEEGLAKNAITEFDLYLNDDSSSTLADLVRQDLLTARAQAAGRLSRGATQSPASTVIPTTQR